MTVQPIPEGFHTVTPYLTVDDTARLLDFVAAAGASSMQEPRDEFYGDRASGVKDPCGNVWWIATHQEDVSPEEIERRMATMQAGGE